MTKCIPSVALILICEDEVYFVRRQNFLNHFPGYTTFPGGKVDSDDNSLEEALFREAKEELNINIKDLSPKNVSEISIAITPDFMDTRFKTHFFRVDLSNKPEITLDTDEAQWGRWYKLCDLIEEDRKGIHLMVPPMRDLVSKLSDNIGLLTHSFEVKIDDSIVPTYESIQGLRMFLPRSNTLPPADRTTAFYYGDDIKVLMDPSPGSESEYQKLKKTLKNLSVDRIFISHHHPDHHERSVQLAKEYGVELYMSSITHNLLTAKYGEGYFDPDVKVHFVSEGDTMGSYLGEEVSIMAVPGHDAGQLALYPKSLKWFIAGDLFQGIGSVIIPLKEGNMGQYFKTLQRVIDLKPNVIFPSHGIGLGGVHVLEKVLAHRKRREQKILKQYQEHKSLEKILEIVYPGLEGKLHQLALINIQSHLDKLREDGVIS